MAAFNLLQSYGLKIKDFDSPDIIQNYKPGLDKAAFINFLNQNNESNKNKIGGRSTLYYIKDYPNLFIKAISDMGGYLFDINEIENEGVINMKLYTPEHPYVSNMIGYIILPSKKRAFFIFDIPPGKNLKQLIRNFHRTEKICSPKRIVKIITELVSGLHYIHSNGILHRDIKPENIYVPDDPSLPAYFLDFGESIASLETKSNRIRGTRNYLPFEDDEYIYSIDTDKYALNKTISKLIANCPPDIMRNVQKFYENSISHTPSSGKKLINQNNVTELENINIYNENKRKVSIINKNKETEMLSKIYRATWNKYKQHFTNDKELEEFLLSIGLKNPLAEGAGIYRGGYRRTFSKKKNKKLYRKTRRLRR